MPLPEQFEAICDSVVSPSSPLCERFQALLRTADAMCEFRNWGFNPEGSAVSSEFLEMFRAVFVPTGSVFHMAANSVPAGFLACNGQLVSRTTYAALFAVIGVVYGVGDGVSTFAVPDMGSKFAMGADGTNAVGTTGGSASVTLTDAQVPPTAILATHPTTGVTLADQNMLSKSIDGLAPQDVDDDGGPAYLSSASLNVAGGGLGHENRPPFMALLAIIKT